MVFVITKYVSQQYVIYNSFYVSALLTTQTAVLARPFLSVCLSVRHSVTFRYCVQMNEDMMCGFQHLVGQSF